MSMQKIETSGRANKGWRVIFLVSADNDSPIETFVHFALFADRRDAEDLATRIRKACFEEWT